MRHDSTIDGCAYCGAPPSKPHTPGCAADPYGVPAGAVPRVSQLAKDDNTRAAQAELAQSRADDPVTKAVDDYLLMERKARAWDDLRAFADRNGAIGLVAQMDTFVQAPVTSARP